MSNDLCSLHGPANLGGARYHVASPFNPLEMAAPEVPLKDRVAPHRIDRNRGSARAMVAGAGTTCCNCIVPVGDGSEQGSTPPSRTEVVAMKASPSKAKRPARPSVEITGHHSPG